MRSDRWMTARLCVFTPKDGRRGSAWGQVAEHPPCPGGRGDRATSQWRRPGGRQQHGVHDWTRTGGEIAWWAGKGDHRETPRTRSSFRATGKGTKKGAEKKQLKKGEEKQENVVS